MSGVPLIHPAAEGDEGVYTEGREGHGHIKSFVRRAGRMPRKLSSADPSSPTSGLIGS